ncbi:putative ACR [compost metagenome]
MKGYQLTLYTQQNRRHDGKMLADWVVGLAMEMGLRGATLVSGIEGFGHTKHFHSHHFFEMADQPMLILMALSEDECDALLKRLGEEGVPLFYVKVPAEFGLLGAPVDA